MKNSFKISFFYTNKSDGNIAFHVNDEKNKVTQNRQALQNRYSIDMKNLRYMNQTHGCNINVVDKTSEICLDDCDALITNELHIPLMVMVADCIPILIYDETKGVVAAVHAGRNSTLLKIAQKTVLKMMDTFSCRVEDIKINLGPSIQKCCYEVSSELVEIVKKCFGEQFVEGRLIDLQGINQKQLFDIGLKQENITVSHTCTKCSGEDYFSYRLDNRCGRFAGVIVIE